VLHSSLFLSGVFIILPLTPEEEKAILNTASFRWIFIPDLGFHPMLNRNRANQDPVMPNENAPKDMH